MDVLVLAEGSETETDLLQGLKSVHPEYAKPDKAKETQRTVLYHRYDPESVEPIADAKYWSISALFPMTQEVLIVVSVHMPSRMALGYQTFPSRFELFQTLRKAIEDAESTVGSSRTVIVGDFNQNPFDPEVVQVSGLNAVMDKRVASKCQCKYNDVEYRFFYNPMWGKMGDASKGPLGTYFYREPELVRYYWHTFDQVLIRPSLLASLPSNHPLVLTEVEGQSLLRPSARPDGKRFSDHLPILFSIYEIDP